MQLNKYKFVIFFFFLFTHVIGNSSLADEFSDIMGDIPLMAGLVEDLDQRLVFDKPEGRIVELAVYGKISLEEAKGFYLEVLPELGWLAVDFNNEGSSYTFERETEILQVLFVFYQNELTINFNIFPKSDLKNNKLF